MEELDLAKLNQAELRRYIRTGYYNHTIDNIQYLDTPVSNDPNTFLNGVGEFVLPTSGYTGTIVLDGNDLTFENGILITLE